MICDCEGKGLDPFEIRENLVFHTANKVKSRTTSSYTTVISRRCLILPIQKEKMQMIESLIFELAKKHSKATSHASDQCIEFCFRETNIIHKYR